MALITRIIKNFVHGLITSIEDNSIPDGAASDSNNWVTLGDKIELRRGMLIMGTKVTGSGQVTGLHTAKKIDGTDITFYTHARKIKYYDAATEEWIEIGTNSLPAAASGEEISFASYHSLAGAQCWLSSPNSDLYKIMTANPGSLVAQYDASYNFKGRIKIKQNRMFLFYRDDDRTGIYGSYIDRASDEYNTETTEAIGSAGSTNYTGTLAFKAGGARRTCFAVTFTDGTETFTDNNDGTLTGSAGGSGTINYATGAYDITFAATAAGSVTATYQWEDSVTDASGSGIARFDESATRVAGEGFVFRQDEDGAAQNIFSIGDTEYCMHETKTWALTLTADDTEATNLIYRDRVGIPNWRAAVETGDGIYYIDDTDEEKPMMRLLTYATGSTEIIPVDKSGNLNLEDYRFDKAAMIEWGDYIVIACRHKDESYNNIVLTYHKQWKCWDKHDWWISCFAINNGSLWGGSSIDKNVFQLFSGMDDDGSVIVNHWISNLTDLQIDALKKTKKFRFKGAIGKNQQIQVYMDVDNSGFVHVGTQNGDDSNVDTSQKVNVGSLTLGRGEVGGGGGDGAIPAYNYEKEISLRLDKFKRIKVKFVAIKIGYASISEYAYHDVRRKQNKLPTKYR